MFLSDSWCLWAGLQGGSPSFFFGPQLGPGVIGVKRRLKPAPTFAEGDAWEDAWEKNAGRDAGATGGMTRFFWGFRG